FGRGGQAVARRAAGNNRHHLVFVDQFCGPSCGFFRAAAIVFDDDVDLATVDTPVLIDLRRGHEHAVDCRAAEVERWPSQISEITNLDRGAIWLLGVVWLAGAGESEREQNNRERRQQASQVKSL